MDVLLVVVLAVASVVGGDIVDVDGGNEGPVVRAAIVSVARAGACKVFSQSSENICAANDDNRMTNTNVTII